MRATFRARMPAFTLGLLAAVLASFPAFAQQPAPPADSQIKALITRELNDRHIRVQVSVAGGVVTLDGMVRSLWEKEEAIDVSHRTRDVQKVISTITIARAESDKAIAGRVIEQLQRYVLYTVFDNVEMSVLNGAVTMTGEVTTPAKSTQIANLVSRVQGVQKIDNRIVVPPVSSVDDQLRKAIAIQIYGDPLFTKYSMQVNPPIHVLVDSGKVTLVGVVASQLEKQTAEAIARNTFGALSVANQLRVERGPVD